MKLINERSLNDKSQCRLDHETALYLWDQGHRLKTTRSSRGVITAMSFSDTLKTSEVWVEFFIETPLNMWEDLLDERHYRKWLEIAVCEDGSYRRPKWHRKVTF